MNDKKLQILICQEIIKRLYKYNLNISSNDHKININSILEYNLANYTFSVIDIVICLNRKCIGISIVNYNMLGIAIQYSYLKDKHSRQTKVKDFEEFSTNTMGDIMQYILSYK